MTVTATLTPTRSSPSTSGTAGSTLTPPNLRYGLPLPVPSSTSSRATALVRALRIRPSKALKVTLGAVIGLLGILATWWALDLAMWTAVKEWRDDCRQQKALNGHTSKKCEEILSKELSPPPTWRSFLHKISNPLQPRYYKFKDPSDVYDHELPLAGNQGYDLESSEWRSNDGDKARVVEDPPSNGELDSTEVDDAQHDELGLTSKTVPKPSTTDADLRNTSLSECVSTPYPSTFSAESSGGLSSYFCFGSSKSETIPNQPRRTLASRSYRSPHERMIDDIIEEAECNTICGTSDANSPREGTRRQGDAAIMYGGMPSPKNWDESNDDQARIVLQTERINPMSRPEWWDDTNSPLGLHPSELEALDWDIWRNDLEWRYRDQISVNHSGTGSLETIAVRVHPPPQDVWRRGCPCQSISSGRTLSWEAYMSELAAGSTISREVVTSWAVVLMCFVFFEWVTDGRGRRRREDEKRRERKMEQERKVKGS